MHRPPIEKLRRLAVVIALLVLCYLVRVPIAYYRSYYAELAGNRTIFDIRSALYKHIQRLSLEYHAKQRSGATTSRLINDVNVTQGTSPWIVGDGSGALNVIVDSGTLVVTQRLHGAHHVVDPLLR
mgnify:CR=1 FL=1